MAKKEEKSLIIPVGPSQMPGGTGRDTAHTEKVALYLNCCLARQILDWW